MTKTADIRRLKEALWGDVRHVLLDMDGTLLDRYFDDYFWEHLVPEKYAEKHDITFGRAKEELLKKYKVHEGTLNWTDIDFWSRELDLDIPALKEQIRHLIEVHPHVEDFLCALKDADKKVVLVTNAHYKTLKIKMRKTQIGRYFDRVITSSEIGCPKEETAFWQRVERILRFDKERTVFIDDVKENLEAAGEFGIRYLVLKTMASSKETEPAGNGGGFLAVSDFKQLLPRHR
ncbi:MAG TPA: HAD family hydrolase [Nitrospirae bacterium]|nr:HAD family hydrolase [Nitrospirota bacterium]